MSCLSDENLAALVDGSAPAAHLSTWNAHISTCDACATRFARKRVGSSRSELVSDSAADPDAPITVKSIDKPNLDAKTELLPSDALLGCRILTERHRDGRGVVCQAFTNLSRGIALLVFGFVGAYASVGARGQVVGQFDRVPENPADEAYIFTPAGFEKAGLPAVAEGNRVGRLEVVVRDAATGRPTHCRVNVVGLDGNFYGPDSGPLRTYSLTGSWPASGWGNRTSKAPIRYFGRFFYTQGEFTVTVPAGPVRVEVWKGFEYRPQALSTFVSTGQTRQVEMRLQRVLPMARLGYWSGDPHLHLTRRSDADDAIALDLLAAEDLKFGVLMCYNPDTTTYTGTMETQAMPQMRGLGRNSVRRRGESSILSGQEYRSTHYGHLNLYLRNALVLGGRTLDPSTWPVKGLIGRETQADGGYAFYAHGGYAQAIYADFVQGAVNGIELLQFGIYRGIGLDGWYRILSSGYRFPATGASDYPPCRKMADCRTYVYHEGRPDFEAWLRGLAEGRSFVTSGPVLLLEVDGKKPGAVIQKSGQGPHRVVVRIRTRCEVTPVTHLRLVVNGATVRELVVPPERGRGGWIDLQETIDLTGPAWIAGRAFSKAPSGSPDAEAHTNPVYVYVDGRVPYDEAALDWLVARLDEQIVALEKRIFPEQPKALAYFQRSREMLMDVRAAGGRRTDDVPAHAMAHDDASRVPLRAFLKRVPAKEPPEALQTFECVDGFQMKLVAAEPLVSDPIAAAFDEQGRLYVAEMRDYPYQPRPGHKPIGRVRRLEDTDGDGQFDTSRVFAEELLWPSGIAPWQGGVFVAATPDIWYLKDTNGDGRADVRERVFTGFGTRNQQGMLNNLVWGMDHWIYGSTGGNGGNIRPGDDPVAEPISVNGRDFRFDPVSRRFETITGTVQFGNTFDDWGNRFVCSESRPALHVVLPQRYLARNPHLPVRRAIHNTAPRAVRTYASSPIEAWRIIRSSRRVASDYLPDSSPAVGHELITAAAGVTVYRGDAYGDAYYGSLFVGGAQNNLVHRRVLEPESVTFRSLRPDKNTEFVRSTDQWFRPVNFVNAPDGTLYVLDMYREILESVHIPMDVVDHLDLKNGRDRGRIYQIAPVGFRPADAPRLHTATTDELVAHLEHPNGWWRDTAHRLLYERQDMRAIIPLRRMLAEGKLRQARLHALWSLDGLGALTNDDVARGLTDESPPVREHAVRLAEARIADSPRLLSKILAMAVDDDIRVRFQVAFTLGQTKNPGAIDALADIAQRDSADTWMRTAILSSVTGSADRLLEALLNEPGNRKRDAGMLLQLAEFVGTRGEPDNVRSVLEQIATHDAVTSRPALQRSLVLALGEGLKESGATLGGQKELGPAARVMLQVHRAWARATVRDESAETEERERAIRLLSCSSFTAAVHESLAALLASRQPASVQRAAVGALRSWRQAVIADSLLKPWRSYSPDVRRDVAQALFSREVWIPALLDAVADGTVAPGQLDAVDKARLRDHSNGTIRTKARQLFGDASRRNRAQAIARYRSALSLVGDAAAGAGVFRQRCATCHRVGDEGYDVGPNLALARSRTPAALLTEILDPSRDIQPGYAEYIVNDKQGFEYTGLLAAETATSITLRQADGVESTILRTNIEQIAATGKSLMPDGLETDVDRQQMADLIAFLLGVRYDLGTDPGLVEPAEDSSLSR